MIHLSSLSFSKGAVIHLDVYNKIPYAVQFIDKHKNTAYEFRNWQVQNQCKN